MNFIADVHAGGSIFSWRRRIASRQAKILPLNRTTPPMSLLVGIARHNDAACAHQRLRETRAVEAKAGASSPRMV
jgi:hypothetical protein